TPAIALRFPRTARRKRRGGGLTSTSAGCSASAISVTAISGLSRTRIEHCSEQVRDQHADQHGERVEEEQSLHERQIVIGGGRIEEIAQSGIREQVLDDDR